MMAADEVVVMPKQDDDIATGTMTTKC